MFDKNILLPDYCRQKLAGELEKYFQINDSGEVAKSTVWDGMKAFLWGKAISILATLQKIKQKKRQERQETKN